MAPPLPSSDADLVRLANGGRDDAFAALYERYFPRVYDFLARLLGNRQEAADVAQDTFIGALEQLGDLREPERFKSWLFTIAHRRGLNKIRGRRLVAVGSTTDDAGPLARIVDDARFGDPVAAATAAEAADYVWEAARGLDERTYVVLDLHVRHGLESAEIADVLGVSKGNAYTMVSRMKKSVADSIGIYLLARKGTGECDELAAIVAGSTLPPMTPALRRSVDRHARSCEICQATRDRLIAPLEVYGSLVLIPPPDGARAAIWAAIAAAGGAATAGRGDKAGGAAMAGAGAAASSAAATGSAGAAGAAGAGAGAGLGGAARAAIGVAAVVLVGGLVWGGVGLLGGDDGEAPVEVLSGQLTSDPTNGSGGDPGPGGDPGTSDPSTGGGGATSTTTTTDPGSSTTTTPSTTTTTLPASSTTTTLPATTTTTIATATTTTTTVTTSTTVPPLVPPATQPDIAVVDEDGSVVIAVLANDVDPDGDIGSASVSVVAGPAHGVASVSGTSVFYVPDADYSGSDSFQYEACDVTAACSVDDVTITIAPQNDPPRAVGPGTIAIGEDQTVAFDPLADAVDPDGDTVTLSDFDAVSVEGGTVRLGSLVYTPPADWSGTDTFTYTLTDGVEDITLTVTVVVSPRNDAPDITVESSGSVDEGVVGAVVAALDVVDVDGDDVTVTLTGLAAESLAYDPLLGTIITTAPFDHETAPGHSIFIRATDENGASSIRSLTFLVNDVNETPALGESTLVGSIDGASGDVVGSIPASDPDGDPLTFSLVESPPGLIQIDGLTGEIRLTGNIPNEPTIVPIVVKVTDPGGLSVEADYVIEFVDITAPSGELLISPDEVFESLGDGFCPLGPAKVSAQANVSDTSGVASVTVSWVVNGSEQKLELSFVKGDHWAGTIEFGPETVSKEAQSAEISLLFAVADNYGNVASAQLVVTVLNCPG